MHKDFLSLLTTLFVCLVLLGLHHAFKDEGDGAAMASVDGRVYSSSEMLGLRRALSAHPDKLLDLKGQDVRAALHEPSLIMSEAPTIIWQYRTDACVLDVYFKTEEGDASSAGVSYYEGRTREDDASKSVADKSCLREIISEQGGWRMVDVSAIYKAP